ncbi:MAG: hypothetical protein ACP5NZ_04455 [Nanobdellota archaeon]
MVNLIPILVALIILIFLVIFISLMVSVSRKRKIIKEIELYLMQAWDAVGKKEITKVRDCYEKIRPIYTSKIDSEKKLLKRITLLYNKILEIEPKNK